MPEPRATNRISVRAASSTSIRCKRESTARSSSFTAANALLTLPCRKARRHSSNSGQSFVRTEYGHETGYMDGSVRALLHRGAGTLAAARASGIVFHEPEYTRRSHRELRPAEVVGRHGDDRAGKHAHLYVQRPRNGQCGARLRAVERFDVGNLYNTVSYRPEFVQTELYAMPAGIRHVQRYDECLGEHARHRLQDHKRRERRQHHQYDVFDFHGSTGRICRNCRAVQRIAVLFVRMRRRRLTSRVLISFGGVFADG